MYEFIIVPESPAALKALVMSPESVLVSWKPPAEPNGEINQYTVYIKPSGDNKEVCTHILYLFFNKLSNILNIIQALI